MDEFALFYGERSLTSHIKLISVLYIFFFSWPAKILTRMVESVYFLYYYL